MCETALDCIQNRFHLSKSQIILVSGGSAWADHVAVRLYLKNRINHHKDPFAGLELHLPCGIISTTQADSSSSSTASFLDTGSTDWRTNPGRSLNYYHSLFSPAIGHSSIDEICLAEKMGASIYSNYNGFHDRNTKVGQCDYMIAFTFGAVNSDMTLEGAMKESDAADGGTMDTWRKCKLVKGINKIHIPLHLL